MSVRSVVRRTLRGFLPVVKQRRISVSASTRQRALTRCRSSLTTTRATTLSHWAIGTGSARCFPT
jgi:hypothetical protein